MSASLKVVLIDDEPLARARMRTLLSQADASCEVVGEFGESVAALMWLREQDDLGQSPDMVLLDIQMPGLDGMVLAARLRDMRTPPAVVFVTAHAEHAVRAFDVAAVDYLTKPVRVERLNASLARVRHWLASRPPEELREPGDAFVVQDRGRVERIPLAHILYFKAEQKVVTLHAVERTAVVSESLIELESRLGPRFVRVHRNTLVARAAMKALARHPDDEEGGEVWAVQIRPTGEWLAVSRRQLATVKEIMAMGS